MSEWPPCGQCGKEMTTGEALAFNYIPNLATGKQDRVCYPCHLKEKERKKNEIFIQHDRELIRAIMEDLLLVWHENENFNFEDYKKFKAKWLKEKK